jgi:hypothetical protein
MRAATGAASLGVAAAIAAVLSTTTDRFGSGVELAGAGALALLVIALAGRAAGFVPGALVLLGASYALSLEADSGTIDGLAVLVAPALLLVSELAYWSLEGTSVPDERGLVARRLAGLGALVAISALATAMLLASSTIAASGVVLVGVGVLAATGALALCARLARRG